MESQWSAGRPRPATPLLDGRDTRRSTSNTVQLNHLFSTQIELRSRALNANVCATLWSFRRGIIPV